MISNSVPIDRNLMLSMMSAEIVRPLVMMNAAPSRMLNMPKVVIIAFIFSRVMISPLTRPISAPKPSAISAAPSGDTA